MASSTTIPRPQPAAVATASAPWILSGWQDLLLFVATPLLIVPLVYLARARYSVDGIALFVAAFGAMGHHLPGLLRAYGDRELFQRFKVRFIVAPLFLLAVCVTASWYESQTLTVVFILWGLWHGLAQVYGFARIYDAKVKSFAPLTARLDLALCALWFGLGMLYSPGRLYGLLNAFYTAGGPLIEPARIAAFQNCWLAATAAVTVAFVGNHVVRRLRGEPQSTIKVCLLASSIAFWWFTMVAIDNVILGIALFEVFHDVQYLAIVWIYNRRRVEQQGSQSGPFTRFLFRRSGLMLGLYLGMVFAYGALGLVRDEEQMDGTKRVLLGALVCSSLLHFYYDGFIWKVRERSTREGLGLQGGAAAAAAPAPVDPLPGWLVHGLKWSLFVVPVSLAAYAETQGGAAPLDRQQNLAAAAPDYVEAHYQLALALHNEKREAEATEHFLAAVRLNPEHADALYWLGNARLKERKYSEAIEHFRAALRMKPSLVAARNNLASALVSSGQPAEARLELEAILREQPANAAAHNNLGNLLAATGEEAAATEEYRRSISADPDFVEARQNLAFQLALAGDLDAAIAEYRQAIAISTKDPGPHLALGMVLYRAGWAAEALTEFARAAELDPNSATAWRMQAWLLATHPDEGFRDTSRALQFGERAVELSGQHDADALDTLAAAEANDGNFSAAIKNQQAALDAGQQAGLPAAEIVAMRDRLALYRRNQPFRDRQ